MRALFAAALLVVACTATPGVEATFCEGHTEGVAVGNKVAESMNLPGPVNPPCPTDRIADMPPDQTPAEVHCYGWIAGFVEVALSHYPDEPPSAAWMVSTFNGCVAEQEAEE